MSKRKVSQMIWRKEFCVMTKKILFVLAVLHSTLFCCAKPWPFAAGSPEVKEYVVQSVAQHIRGCDIVLLQERVDELLTSFGVIPWYYATELGLMRWHCVDVLKGDISLADYSYCFFYETPRMNLEYIPVSQERADVEAFYWKGKIYYCRGREVWKFYPPYDPFEDDRDEYVRLMFVTPEKHLDTSRIKLIKNPYEGETIANRVKGDVMKMSSDELMRALKLESVFSNRVFRLNEGGVFQVDYDVPQLKGRVLRKEAQKCLEYAKEANNSLMHLSADEVSEIVYLAYAADGDTDGTRYAAAARRCPKILKPFKPPFRTEIGRRVHEVLTQSVNEEFADDSAVKKYVESIIEDLMRVTTRSDVGILYDVAERLGKMKGLIIPNYTRIPSVLNATFTSPNAAREYEKKVKEGDVQLALRKAWIEGLFMLVAQTINALCGEESAFQTNTIQTIAGKSGLSKYETDCFLHFREKKILPRDEQAFPIRTATVAEIVEFFRQIDENGKDRCNVRKK